MLLISSASSQYYISRAFGGELAMQETRSRTHHRSQKGRPRALSVPADDFKVERWHPQTRASLTYIEFVDEFLDALIVSRQVLGCGAHYATP